MRILIQCLGQSPKSLHLIASVDGAKVAGLCSTLEEQEVRLFTIIDVILGSSSMAVVFTLDLSTGSPSLLFKIYNLIYSFLIEG